MRLSRDTTTGAEWDAFVRQQTGWTHFHLHGWRAVLQEFFGHECLYLEARDGDGALAGILPLVRVRSRLFGHYLVSMPFLNYGGPLGSAEAVQALIDEAVRIADRDGVRLLELRSRTALPTRLEVSHRKVTTLLDLTATTPELWQRLPAKVRSQVRRPMKEGVDVRSGPDQLGPFHTVFAHHMRDLGTPAQPLSFFESIAHAFPGTTRFSCAYLDGRPIACGCGFLWDDEFEITWASALRAHKPLAANMLLYWHMMEGAIADGARIFNFGRCTPGSGTHRFKQQWGGRDEPLWWYQHASRPGRVTATPSPDHGPFALASRVWSRIPVPVATRLGPSIVRYIP